MYNPYNWYWTVGSDITRAWSSAASSYVTEWPEDTSTHILSEQELSDLLYPYGLVGPYVDAQSIKNEAQRRIIIRAGASDIQACIIKQLNAQMRATELVNIRALGGTLSPEEEQEASALEALAADIKHIRHMSDILENTLPQDYRDDRHWQ